MRGRRVLVTGATGFVGSHLVRRLLREGAAVHVLTRPESDFWRLRDVVDAVEPHQADLLDAPRLGQMVGEARPDYVFHLAAATIVAGATGTAEELIRVNLLGTVNLLEACEATGYQGMVTTGDSFEYSATDAPLRESSSCQPDTLHGITKLAATLQAQAVARDRGRPIVVLRLFSTYGPGDNPRRLVPRVIAGALAGTPLPLSRPDITRDWVHVEDLVGLYLEAAVRAGSLSGGVFNAGSGKGTPLSDVVAAILKLTGSSAEPRWGTFPAPGHDRHPWVADMTRTFEAFSWRPTRSLQEGLKDTIDAARRESLT